MRAELLTHAVTSRTRAIFVAHVYVFDQYAVFGQYAMFDQCLTSMPRLVDQYGAGDQACGRSC